MTSETPIKALTLNGIDHDKVMVLIAIASDSSFSTKHRKQLYKDNYFSSDTALEDYVWKSIYAFCERYDTKCPHTAIFCDVMKRITQEMDTSEFKWTTEDALTLIHDCCNLKLEDATLKAVEDIIQKYHQKCIKEKLQLELSSPQSSDAITDILKTAAKELSLEQDYSDIVKIPMMGNIQERVMENPRVSLGVEYLDALMDGGPRLGEAVLAVMPPKTGKTTMALQIQYGCMINKRRSVYVSFEQPEDGDILQREVVLSSGLSRFQLEKQNWKFSEKEELRINSSKLNWQKYALMFDYSNVSRKFTTFREMIDIWDKLIGDKPEVVIIDWLGAAFNRMRQHISTAYRNNEPSIRAEFSNELQLLVSAFKERKVQLIVFHQLAGAMANKKTNSSVFDAAGSKDIIQLFDYGFSASRPNMDGVFTFTADAMRATKSGKVRLRISPDTCVLTQDDSDHITDFVNPKRMKTGALLKSSLMKYM